MIYPNSNLPTVSQAWGRAVQKGLESLEATVKSNDINNRARDAQLQANYVQTNKNIQDIKFALTSSGIAVTGVNEIKDAIYVPGTTLINGNSIQTGTLSADKITTGTLTGLTVQTASSGSRVVLSGVANQLQFYYGGSPAGNIEGWTKDGSPVINVNGTTVVNSTLFANQVVSSGYVFGTSGIFDLVSAPSIDTDDLSTVALSVSGSSNTTGITNTGGITSTGTIATDGGLRRTAYAGGGTTGASVDNNGTFIRTSSSARYKQDIQDAQYAYEAVIGLQPKSFRLKNEVAEDDNAIFYPGFVAEELAGTDLDIFVSYETLPDGTKRPDGVRYAELTSALVSAVKHQDSLIRSLTARIEALESKV